MRARENTILAFAALLSLLLPCSGAHYDVEFMGMSPAPAWPLFFPARGARYIDIGSSAKNGSYSCTEYRCDMEYNDVQFKIFCTGRDDSIVHVEYKVDGKVYAPQGGNYYIQL